MMAHSRSSASAKTTNDLLQEIAVLSNELDAIGEGVGATERCQRCWYPASSHASKTSRHCKRREKMSGKSFVDSLLAQRNNLARVLATVKGEAKKEKEIRELQERVDFSEKEMEEAKSKIRKLVVEKEFYVGLMRDLDVTYKAFAEGEGSLEEFNHAFHEVVDRISEGGVDESSDTSEDEDDDWDHAGDRKAVNASSLVNVHNTQGNAGTSELSEDNLGILTVRPCNPNFAVEASRLESYRGKWPSNVAQSPDLLSSAGFFYVGYADNVKCFFCDGGLYNWESNDEPWTEHARWYPDCGFLKQVKGTTFIKKVRTQSKMEIINQQW